MFQFKKFKIDDSLCAMKVGTDGVLLGAWCGVEKKTTVLDLGTGSGLIAIMIAQRNPLAQITGMDIDPSAVEQAIKNGTDCPWVDRLHWTQQDFLKPNNPFPQYDLIVSNPPFFENSLHNPESQKALARHDFDFQKMIEITSQLLLPSANLELIVPYSIAAKITELATKNNLQLSRRLNIKGHASKPFKRVCLSFTNIPVDTVLQQDLTIEISRHVYTPEYIDLVKDFYLKM